MGLRDILRKRLGRGKVECNLVFRPQVQNQTLIINEDLVAQVSAAADHMHGIIGPASTANKGALDALEILKCLGVLTAPSLDAALANEEALAAFDHTLSDLIAMREREGAALKVFIEQRLTAINIEVQKVKALLPEILTAQRENLKQKLNDLALKVDDDRLEQEMVLVLQKTDVDEELDRLEAHLCEVTRILNLRADSGSPIGRRLDFMMQELNREANTLSSKSISHLTTIIAVELKVLIEKMREQIQNLE